MRKDRIDGFGTVALVSISLLFGYNQALIKLTNEGLQPVFAAGLRSVIAAACIAAWLLASGRSMRIESSTVAACALAGLAFATEFVFLFISLDLTTVVRASIFFYSMPVWLAVFAHFLIPNERMHTAKAAGLALAATGMVVAILSRRIEHAEGSLVGDLCAIAAAVFWALIPVIARVTAFQRVTPEMQMLWQVTISAPILLIASLFFGPWIRDFELIHALQLGIQGAVVVGFGFTCWFTLLRIYPATGVASFSFLSPAFSVVFGWLMLGESIGYSLLVALVLVSAGLVLINRPNLAVGRR